MFLHPSSWLLLRSMFVLRQQLCQWDFGQKVLSRILLVMRETSGRAATRQNKTVRTTDVYQERITCDHSQGLLLLKNLSNRRSQNIPVMNWS